MFFSYVGDCFSVLKVYAFESSETTNLTMLTEENIMNSEWNEPEGALPTEENMMNSESNESEGALPTEENMMNSESNESEGALPTEENIMNSESNESEGALPIEENVMNSESNHIQPLVGDLNVDLDLSADKEEIESGTNGVFVLNFKTTGALNSYSNANLKIQLPKGIPFNQETSELGIAGVNPIYDEDSSTLNYFFPKLDTGKNYRVLIYISPSNGITLNDTLLEATASFFADELSEISDNAIINVKSSTDLVIDKSYSSTEGKTAADTPNKGDVGIWDIKSSILKKETGLLYLKEGSKVRIEDTLPSGTTYISSNPEGRLEGNKVIWEFDVPTLEQQKNLDVLFQQDLQIKLRFDDSLSDFENVTNNVTISATDLGDRLITSVAEATIQISNSSNEVTPPEGDLLIPHHNGPIDAFDTYHQSSYDPFPQVYDWATLKFITTVGGVGGIQTINEDFQSYILEYTIDPNLTLQKFWIPNDFRYSRVWNEDKPLSRIPTVDIELKINGEWREVKKNAKIGQEYYRTDFGLSINDRVDAIKFDFNNAPYGFYSRSGIDLSFTVKKGYVGEVENIAHYYGVDGNGLQFDFGSTNDKDINGPRHATILPTPPEVNPISQVKIQLENHDKNIIQLGENILIGTLENNLASLKSMSDPLKQVVILPKGVTVNPDSVEYMDAKGNWSVDNGRIEVISNNYNGTGKQAIRITWNETELKPKQDLKFKVNVSIQKVTDSILLFDTSWLFRR